MSRFRVIIEKLPEDSKEAMKHLRTISMNSSLTAALDLYNYMSATGGDIPLMDGISGTKAELFVSGFRALGGAARVEPSETAHPLVLEPEAATTLKWGGGLGTSLIVVDEPSG